MIELSSTQWIWFGIGWYLIGLLGNILIQFVSTYLRGYDFTIKDLILMIIFAVFGPIMVLIGIFYWFSYGADSVIIKGRNGR